MRWKYRAVIAACVIVVLTAITIFAGTNVLHTSAASGALSALSQSVVSDGTAPFDAGNDPGQDSGANNNIVRTHDTFEINWAYVVATPGDVTFTQTLVNAFWAPESVGACSQGTAAISANKRTITCTLSNLSLGSGSYTLRAVADGAAAHNAIISGTVSAGASVSQDISLAISATPKMNISTMNFFATASKGPGAYSAVDGYVYDVPVSMWANVSGTMDGFNGVKGLESIGSQVTFNAVPSLSTAVLHSCAAGPAGGTRPELPNGSGGDGITNLNSVRNSGSWTCIQNSVGGTVQVSIAGMDSTLNSYPIRSANNTSITSSGKAYFSVGYIRLWIPKTSTTPNALTTFSTQISNFDPVSVSGASNYDTGYAPQQEPSAACATGTYHNCSSVTINRTFQNIYPSIRALNSSMGLLPGSSVSWDGNGQVVSGSSFYASSVASVPTGNDQMTNTTVCMKWDPALTRIDTTKPVVVSNSASLVSTIEYGTTSYSSLSTYQANDCGRPGVNTTNWFSSVAAAGGASAVTAVRVTFQGQFGPSASFGMDVPQIAVSGLNPGTQIGFFGTVSSNEIGGVASSYNSQTNTGVAGTRVNFIEAQVGIGISWDTDASSAPVNRTVTVSPQLLTGTVARDVSVKVTLPSACFDYVPGSSSIAPATITPANVGPDGFACTNDDVSPAQLIFDFGDVNATPQPFTLGLNISHNIATPSNATVTAHISSPSDPVVTAAHSATDVLAVSAVAGFSVSKTADTGRVSNGVPFTYTISWRNGSSTQSGSIHVVDVLPFEGDSRGSSGFDSLMVNSVTTTGATVEYSSLDSANALSLAEQHADGNHPDFGWTTTKPAQVTAIRFYVAQQPASSSGFASVNVTAQSVTSGGVIINDLYGLASFATEPLKAAQPLTIQTLGTASMNVTHTANLSEITTAGQTVVYTVHVHNTGQETLSGFSVSNAGFSGSGSPPAVTCPSLVLAAGESMNCTSTSYVVPQTDIDQLATLTHSVQVSANPPAGSPLTSPASSVSTPINGRSLLTLSQSASASSVSHAGTTVTYTYTLTNAGTRTLTNPAAQLSGTNGSGVVTALVCGGASSLAPGASTVCTSTYTVSQDDMDNVATVNNSATASATSSSGAVISSNSTTTQVEITKTPSLMLVKSANISSYSATGQPFQFVFTVTNNGNVTVEGIHITELSFSGEGSLNPISCARTVLSPGEQTSCLVGYTTTQRDLDNTSITNVAEAHGVFQSQNVTSTPSRVTVNASGIQQQISLDAYSDETEAYFANDTVNYRFVITNRGNVTLTNIQPSVVTYNATGTLGSISCPVSTLLPEESMTCVATYNVRQQDIDTLSTLNLVSKVTASTPTNTSVTDTADTVVVDLLPIPHLDVEVLSSRSSATTQGESVTFTVRVKNDGAMTMRNVTATTDTFTGTGTLGFLQCPAGTVLAPQQSVDCEVTYVITQNDLDTLSEIELTAYGEGEYGISNSYSTQNFRDSNDSTVVRLIATSQLSMVKTASIGQIESAGTTLTYSFLVTNIGTKTLSNVLVEEQTFTGLGVPVDLDCPSVSVLSPRSHYTCTATYTSVSRDLQLNQITNTAVATSNNNTVISLSSTAKVTIKKDGEYFSQNESNNRLSQTGWNLTTPFAAVLALIASGGVFLMGRSAYRRG